MPEIKPFRGILYNQTKVSMSDVVAPPYDVIAPEQQGDLYNASPFNVVRLDFGKEEDRYVSAARLLAEWRANEILVQDEVPAMYLLAQDFKSPGGKDMQRLGFVALCRLEELGKGSILPHEKTLPKPKEDRLQLLQAAHANFSQIFVLYEDPERRVEKLSTNYLRQINPFIEVDFEGVRNRVWKLQEGETVSSLQELMKGKKVFVADGHHRYETALEFRNVRQKNNPNHTGNESYNFIMMYFCNVRNKGLMVLPTHRIVHGLQSFNEKNLLHQLSLYFRVGKLSSFDELVSELQRKERYAFGLIVAEEPRYHLFSLMSVDHLKSLVPSRVPLVLRGLDVTVLHTVVFEKILAIPPEIQKQKAHLEYVKDSRQVDDAVKTGKVQAGFLMNPTSVDQIRSVAEAGKMMPQKSTYFYPKLLSGLVIHSLDHD